MKCQHSFGKHYGHRMSQAIQSFRALCMPGDPSTAWKVLLAGQLIEDPAPRLQWSGHFRAPDVNGKLRQVDSYFIFRDSCHIGSAKMSLVFGSETG